MRHHRAWWGVGILLAALGGSLAQAQPEREEIPRRISVLVTRQPIVSVTYTGRYGLMRLTGTLVRSPASRLEMVDSKGTARQVRWEEIRELQLVPTVTADLPSGSYTAVLSSDAGALSRSMAAPSGYLATPSITRTGQYSWRVRALPEGELVLAGAPYREARIPTSRITHLAMQPLSGSLVRVPDATITIEVDDGQRVTISLVEVQSLRHDTTAGILTATLHDGQIFTGKPSPLPSAAYSLRPESGGEPVSVPVDQIAQMEIIVPPAGLDLGRPSP